MTKRTTILFALLFALAAPAAGAELTQVMGMGAKLNGASPETLPIALEPGDVVEGPALVKTADGHSLQVSRLARLEVLDPEGDVELFFVKSGIVRGTIGDKVQVAGSLGWFAVPTGGSAQFYVETHSAESAAFKTNEGLGLVVYRKFCFKLEQGHHIELGAFPGKPGDIQFKTDQANPGDVMMLNLATRELALFLSIPKATSGAVRLVEGGAKTHLTSDAGSWKGGKIGIRTWLSGAGAQAGSLGPGTYAIINNLTGEIEFGFVEVDFEIIKRAVALTSEFTALATSNFFGVSR